MGYKYYETASEEESISYDELVQYPFGYGLSYTTFEQKLNDLDIDDSGNITVSVDVTNTGSKAGKDVVEVYYTPPYTNGGIEKASVNLIDFGKTEILEPGASQTITVTFNEEDMASFDDKNTNSYVLEQGTYNISLRSDSHTVIDSKDYEVTESIIYGEGNARTSDETAAVSQLSDAAGDVTYLSRADHFANFAEATAEPTDYNMSDYFGNFGYMDADQQVRNGCDRCLANYDVGTNYMDDTTSATSIKAMRQACKNMLYTTVNSRVYAGDNADPSMETWKIILIVTDIILVAGLILLETLAVRKYLKRKSHTAIKVETDKQNMDA